MCRVQRKKVKEAGDVAADRKPKSPEREELQEGWSG